MAAIDSGDVIQISRGLGISEFEPIGQRPSQQGWNARKWWIAKIMLAWRKGWLTMAKTFLGSAVQAM
jgi:hypothetical protein